MGLPLGTKLGAYEIVAPIGAGGMGEVYRARDSKLGRDVALKLLADSISTDSESRARFNREARTLASLNHPGIVTIFAIEQSGEHDFIAMELVEGRPLSDLIVKGGLKLDRLLNIAAQIAAAVAAAHKHGIVHRDVKPANVIVGPQDRVKVLDFGIAKLRADAIGDGETLLPTKDITGQGRVLGTVSYMSPEQAEGRPIDDRSDVFSLGVVLYEMATGERPFKGDSSLSVLSAILKDTPKPVTEISPALPRELSRIVRRCLAKDPDERYQSATDLRNDLDDLKQSVISGELMPVVGRSPGAPGVGARGWLAVAVLGSAAVLGIAWGMTRGPAPTPALPQLTVSRLTLLEGITQEPMISPDGKWVVYVSNATGNQDIYLQSTTGQTAINLTKDSLANDSQPALSADGEKIAFRSEREGGGLFVMGRTGESVRRLTRIGYQPAWFPDGRTIVFATIPVLNAESRGGDSSELWTVDAAGGEPRKLFSGDAVQPRVSPGGRRIAYWSLPVSEGRFVAANRDVWTMAIDGSDPVRVTTDSATDWNPSWSPDGRWLYFLSNRAGTMNLWRLPIDESTGKPAGEPQALTAPAPYVRHFSLSADGRLGAFATQDVSSNLARIAFDPKSGTVHGPVQSLTSGPRDFNQLDISPDGSEIVVASNPRIQEDLFLLATDGRGVIRNLTNDRERDRSPRWLPDGKSIVFYSDRNQNYDLWTIDRDGGGLRQLTQTVGRRYFPLPTPDGKRLAAADISAWQLFVHDPRDFTRQPEALPAIPDALRSPGGTLTPTAWSPDGTKLVGSTTVVGVWLYDSATHSYRRVGPAGALGGRWLPDGRRILAVLQGRLIVFDADSGAFKEILAVPAENLGAPALAPNGDWLFFSRTTTSGDVWLARFDDGTDRSKTPKSQ